MTGFRHDIAGGSGKLIIPALQSPNFIHALQGWAINSDGSAEFHDISIPAGSGGTVVTFSGTQPVSPNVGDVWYNTSNGLEVSVWNGTSWVAHAIGTNAIAGGSITNALLNAAVTARSIGGITTTISATTPASPVAGDLWINSTNGYQLEQYNGSSFVPVTWDAANILAANSVGAGQLSASITARSLGGVTTTIAASAPASPLAGDLWINSTNGYQIEQYNGTSWTPVTWNAADVIAAGSVGAAQLSGSITARSLGGITTTIAATAPGSPVTGDIWIDSANGYQLQQWNGSAWTPISWDAHDVIQAGTITATEILANTITASQIAAGTITAGQIQAGTITAAQIAANTITAAQIQANTITAGQIAANTITAAQILANTITATQIATGTITAAQIQAGTITTSQINASAGITGSQIAAGTITAGNILANTITASQLAAGIVYAGIVNSTTINAATFTGSTFEGTDFIINSSGAFFYSGTPAAGNLVTSITNASGTDGFGNAYQAGIFFYENSGSGNSLGGLIWNTVVGSEPLLALFPDSTVGFTGHSPFVTSQVFNRGAVNEYLALSLGGGATTGASSPVMMNMFSKSKDNTLNPHISFYAGSSADLVLDVNGSGISAANPTSAGTIETWHNVTLDSGWSNATGYSHLQYRLLPDGNVQVTGGAQHTSLTSTLAINSSNPLPSQYRPASSKSLSMGNSPLANLQAEIRTDGVIYALANGSAAGTKAIIDAAYPLVV